MVPYPLIRKVLIIIGLVRGDNNMRRKIIGIFVCTLMIATVVPTVGTSALLKNTLNQLMINLENSYLYFNINPKNWSYKNSDIQIQIARNNSNPCIGVISSYKSPLYQLRNTCSDDITTIHEESTSQVIVIKLSSTHEIQIKNITVKNICSVINKQKTDLSITSGVYLVNASGKLYDLFCSALMNLHPDKGTLQYFKLGPYIYNNRAEQDFVGWAWTLGKGLGNYSLPPGDWYFIFYAGFYDVPNNNTFIQTNISINIIDIPNDLKVIKNEEGTFYSYWYGELNPILVISKAWEFELMFHGTKQFSINNTCFFQFFGFPVSDGYWSIRWITPTGIKKCKIKVYDGVFNSTSSEEEVNWCISGNGGSGRYKVTTHYVDRACGGWSTCPSHLSAIDVPLK